MNPASSRFVETPPNVKRAHNFKDLTGMVFNNLTALAPMRDLNSPKLSYWKCRCTCGNLTTVNAGNLSRGQVKSCGCLREIRENLIGQRFGKLTVVAHAPDVTYGKNKVRWAAWKCVCDCGGESVVSTGALKRKTRSCGCLQVEKSTTHGATRGKRTDEFVAWVGMKQRCLNPKTEHYDLYGGRGIKVCDRWMDFQNFLDDMGSKPSKKHSVERINSNGNYEPSNCKWGTSFEQQNNRSNNHWVEFDGKRMTCAQWDRHLSLPKGKIAFRLAAGWTIEDAIKTPNQIHMYRRKNEPARTC